MAEQQQKPIPIELIIHDFILTYSRKFPIIKIDEIDEIECVEYINYIKKNADYSSANPLIIKSIIDKDTNYNIHFIDFIIIIYYILKITEKDAIEQISRYKNLDNSIIYEINENIYNKISHFFETIDNNLKLLLYHNQKLIEAHKSNINENLLKSLLLNLANLQILNLVKLKPQPIAASQPLEPSITASQPLEPPIAPPLLEPPIAAPLTEKDVRTIAETGVGFGGTIKLYEYTPEFKAFKEIYTKPVKDNAELFKKFNEYIKKPSLSKLKDAYYKNITKLNKYRESKLGENKKPGQINFIYVFKGEEFNRLKQDATTIINKNKQYLKKYLKYKNKYLKLKELLNI
jgi:hypothetical protein